MERFCAKVRPAHDREAAQTMGATQTARWRQAQTGRSPRSFGRGDRHFNRFFGVGMQPSEPSACQMKAMAGVVRWAAVGQITHHRMTHGCCVSTYLMGSSSKQFPFDQSSVPMNAPRSRP